MRCERCRWTERPGFVREHHVTDWSTGYTMVPCPDCGGTMTAHCCDGLTAVNDVTDTEAGGGDA